MVRHLGCVVRAFDHVLRDGPPHVRGEVRVRGSGVEHGAAAPVAVELESHTADLDGMAVGKDLGHLDAADQSSTVSISSAEMREGGVTIEGKHPTMALRRRHARTDAPISHLSMH